MKKKRTVTKDYEKKFKFPCYLHCITIYFNAINAYRYIGYIQKGIKSFPQIKMF